MRRLKVFSRKWTSRSTRPSGLEAARLVAAGADLARRIGSASLDWLAPSICRECGTAVPPRHAFCAACIAAIPWTAEACSRCARPLPNPPPGACGRCLVRKYAFDRAAAGGPYRRALRTAVLRWKFHRERVVLPLIEGALRRAARSPSVRGLIDEAEAIVPVPSHPLKKWWRGWDPVGELAAGLAESLVAGRRLEVRPLLRKTRWTAPQVGLPAPRRRGNLRRAFRARGAVPRTVVLLDDVFTTGTTASECARALKLGGARRVIVLAAARS